MTTDFEIYNNIIAILFSFYVFLTFTEKKKYISNLAMGFALYLIALSLFVFRDIIITGVGEHAFFILIKTSYFSAPFFIYNALSEFANIRIKNAWISLLVVSISWIIISELAHVTDSIQLAPLAFIGASIYIYTAYITIRYRQVGAPIRGLTALVLSALSVMFISVLFVEVGDIYDFIDLALRNSILAVIALMVTLIMMYFQKVRAILIEQQEKIDYLNYHDEVTGLYNKTYFEEKRDEFLDKENYPISAMVIDSAALSIVNSKYGIFSNEQVLEDAALKFNTIKNENEILYKLGNEEILIVMLKTGFAEVKIRAAEYHKLIEENSDKISGVMFGLGTMFEPIQDQRKIVEEALSNLYINKLINNRNYVSNFISYFSSRIHRQEGKSEERLKQVKKMAINLGYRIGIEEDEMVYLEKICDLYDIGKISIPFRILEKKEALSDDEWEIIRRYPEFSYDIVNAVYGDKKLADAVRSVRERWDGKGYPKGLAKGKIPRVSRILNIVESFDSMTNSEVGRKITKEEAVVEIEKNKGSQFDPDYVGVFVEYMKEKIKF